MGKKRRAKQCPVKFYVALQGDKHPGEYIRLGKRIEKMGFDRIYVYDDLMYRPSFPILNLIAANTKEIQLGPCLVNGFYRHPAIIAENAVFLDELSGGRSILGVGRGAFYDYLNIPHSEEITRQSCEETIQLVKRFISKSSEPFKGKYFEASEKAVLRWNPIRKDIPLVMGSWNEKMAYLAGKHCSELQVAESWDPDYLEPLFDQLMLGAKHAGRKDIPFFSIGGISCIAMDEKAAYQHAKRTLAVYLPYLKSIMATSGLDTESEAMIQIEHFSKQGKIADAMPFISDEIVDSLSLSGRPDKVKEKLLNVIDTGNIRGILFSPPYGALESIEDNLQLIMDKVVNKIRGQLDTGMD
jgi:5,10-methylenetetrahydromethanopterin reductase